MESFQRLHNGRIGKIKDIDDAKKIETKRRLMQQIRSNKYRFAGLRDQDPVGYESFKESVLKQEIKDLKVSIKRELRVLRRKDITEEGRRDILHKIDELEGMLTDINYYLQEMAEGNPEPIEA